MSPVICRVLSGALAVVFVVSSCFLPVAKAAPEDVQAVKRLAVMRFGGPSDADVDTDILWKFKNHLPEPGSGAFRGLSIALQWALVDKLARYLGNRLVIAPTELTDSLQSIEPGADRATQMKHLCHEVGAKYAVTGKINRVEFRGENIHSDEYVMVVTVKLIDTSTNKVVFSEKKHEFVNKLHTDRLKKTPPEVFADVQIPEIADYFAERIAGALGR